MPRLIRGDRLPDTVRREVLAAFPYRLTTENGYPARNPTGARIPAVSDAQWLRDNAFYVTARGRLADRPGHCEPWYLVEEEEGEEGCTA